MRKPVIAGNWKMYKTAAETGEFLRKFAPMIAHASRAEIVICAPFVNLPAAVEAVDSLAMSAGQSAAHDVSTQHVNPAPAPIEIGAQDVFWLTEGAYTGEVSAPMLTAIGCKWVIIGHSERRHYFGETNDSVLKKTVAALAAGLKPIVCVGERLEERESGATESVLATQCHQGILGLDAEQFEKIVIAYEPVWAIGTGKTATPEIAADAHAFLRSQLATHYGHDLASRCRLLYGGSVKPDNVTALMAQPQIDGALVGGASLEPASFASIVNY